MLHGPEEVWVLGFFLWACWPCVLGSGMLKGIGINGLVREGCLVIKSLLSLFSR